MSISTVGRITPPPVLPILVESSVVNRQQATPLVTAAAHWPEQAFSPLERETRPTVNTEQAAYYLNRKPQTLRAWACLENGPIRPLRICGRLAWPVAVIRELTGAAK